MKREKTVKAAGVAIAFGAIVLAGMWSSAPRVRANNDGGEESLVQLGFQIAPVPLSLAGKNRELVGLASTPPK